MPAQRKKTSRRIIPPPRGNRFFRHPVVRFLLVLFSFWACLGVVISLLILFHYHRRAGRYDLEAVRRLPMESRIIAADGAMLGFLHGEDVGHPVKLEQVSPLFIDALIAREDSRFWKHGGVDMFGLMRAWARNLKDKRLVQGGSTITMQLARMSFGLSERSIERKLLEIAIARRIEDTFTKEEILYQYVNRVFLGTGMNGIEQAASGYFGKSSAELSLPEAAMIAGIIRAPNGFSPFRHPDASVREMNTTLERMVTEDMISKDEALQAENTPPTVLAQSRWMEILRTNSKVSQRTYLLDMVERRVEELLPSLAQSGGFSIYTTFDSRVQRTAESAMEGGLSHVETLPEYRHPRYSDYDSGDPRYLQGAAVVIENQSGALRALVGGRNYEHSAYNRAIYPNRQAGSVFKPLVYATAFEMGMFPGTIINDAPIQPGEIRWDKTDWSPTNADGRFLGPTPAALGLIQSRNTMTVRVGEWAGIENVLTMMEHAGLRKVEDLTIRAPIYIGTVGTSVVDLTSAYTIFANGGRRFEPYYVERVIDRDGSVLFEQPVESYRVVSEGATWLTSKILQQVVEEGGTGANLRQLGFPYPAGGKTGTTNDFYDAWFAGYTSRLTAAVWMGLDTPDTIIQGAYGGKVALPVWKDVMTEAGKIGYEFEALLTPSEVIPMNLCRTSGKLANDRCQSSGNVYVEQVPSDLIPRKFCKDH